MNSKIFVRTTYQPQLCSHVYLSITYIHLYSNLFSELKFLLSAIQIEQIEDDSDKCFNWVNPLFTFQFRHFQHLICNTTLKLCHTRSFQIQCWFKVYKTTVAVFFVAIFNEFHCEKLISFLSLHFFGIALYKPKGRTWNQPCFVKCQLQISRFFSGAILIEC